MAISRRADMSTPKKVGNNMYKNRAERRTLNRSTLVDDVITLRKEMYEAGLEVPALPRQRNRKVFSDYESQLVRICK